MRTEPPDQLTGAVWQMLINARTSPMTREEATEQAILFLRRNLSYLARRERRKRHTSYDELLARDLEAVARLVVLLEPHAETTPPAARGYAHADPRAAPTPEVLLEPSSTAARAAAESAEDHEWPGYSS
jgi:hypothetical protein